jgi:hypothetical protein
MPMLAVTTTDRSTRRIAHALALGGVPDEGPEPRSTFHDRSRYRQLHRNLVSFSVQADDLEDLVRHRRHVLGIEHAPDRGEVGRPVALRDDQPGHHLALCLTARPSKKPLGGRIPVGDPALIVGPDEGVGRAGHRCPLNLDSRAQLRLGQLLVVHHIRQAQHDEPEHGDRGERDGEGVDVLPHRGLDGQKHRTGQCGCPQCSQSDPRVRDTGWGCRRC